MSSCRLFELSAIELLARYRERSLSPVEACSPCSSASGRGSRDRATYALDARAALQARPGLRAALARGAPQGDSTACRSR